MHQSSTFKTVTLILLLLISWGGSGCVREVRTPDGIPVLLPEPSDSPSGRQSACQPRFPDFNGWYGADAAYSVPLRINDGRASLWLFGDSFVRQPDAREGRVYPFIHNSIGISTCTPSGEWRLDTFWQRDLRGRPRAFFAPDTEAGWVRRAIEQTGVSPYYWLLDGFLLDDVLFVGLLRVVHSEPRGPFNLPFRLAGMDLARIENYTNAPKDWRVQISKLSDDVHAVPGSAFVVTPSHVYAFAFLDLDGGRAPRILSRIDRAAFDRWQPDLSSAFETLSSDSNWKPGLEPHGAMIVMDDDASEMSVHFDHATKRWIAVYSDLARRHSTESVLSIKIRRSPTLAGPWSKPEQLVSIPETVPGHSRSTDENLFCYAGKAHPQFSAHNELVVTYVCNLFARRPEEVRMVLEQLRESVDLYRPRAISVALPNTDHSNSPGERAIVGQGPQGP